MPRPIESFDYSQTPIGRRQLLSTAAGGLLFVAACEKKEQPDPWKRFKTDLYEIDYPTDWQQLRSPDGLIDSFIDGRRKNTPTVVSVVAAPPRFATLQEEVQYIIPKTRNSIRLANPRAQADIRTLSRPDQPDPSDMNHVGMYPAYQLEHDLPPNNVTGPTRQRTMLFQAENTMWYINMATDPKAVDEILPQFKHMLASFRPVATRRG